MNPTFSSSSLLSRPSWSTSRYLNMVSTRALLCSMSLCWLCCPPPPSAWGCMLSSMLFSRLYSDMVHTSPAQVRRTQSSTVSVIGRWGKLIWGPAVLLCYSTFYLHLHFRAFSCWHFCPKQQFPHTFTHRPWCQPCKETASSSETVIWLVHSVLSLSDWLKQNNIYF